jgi:thiamine biosynthesis lipoprotein
MKRKSLIKGTVLLSALSSLAACGQSQTVIAAYSFYAPSITPTTGEVHASDADGNLLASTTLAPFDTSIQLIYYGPEGMSEDTDFETDFGKMFAHYHALFDRHYNYVENGKLINNIKTLNDSYGTGKAVVLDADLYKALKKSYLFSLNSDGKFNIGVGSLSSVWDYQINDGMTAVYDDTMTEEMKKCLNDSYLQERTIWIDPADSWMQIALNSTPTTQELKDMLTFDDASFSVTFNSVGRIDAYLSQAEIQDTLKTIKLFGFDLSKPSLTLGGFGKGEATQLFAEKYPSRGYLINSGTSSIKCVQAKPDGTPWNLRISNPYYFEGRRYAALTLNSYDLVLSESGTFDLSTSAYYEQYFYVLQTDGTYKRRTHIFDSSTGYSHEYFAAASVLSQDSGWADMYTTALMNTDSVEEAEALKAKLDAFTGEDTKAFYLVNNLSETGVKSTSCLAEKEIVPLLSDATVMYPDSAVNKSITKVSEIAASSPEA